MGTTKVNSGSFSHSITAEDTLIYIPFALQDSNTVNGYLLARINDNIEIQINLASDYLNYSFNNFNGMSASQYVFNLIALDKLAFGHNDYTINDPRLFSDSALKQTRSVKFLNTPLNPNLSEQICFTLIHSMYVNYDPDGDTDPTHHSGNEYYLYTINELSDYCVTGGGNGPIVTTTAGMPPIINSGGPTGWEPTLNSEEPYVCKYQLNQTEIDVFNQIDAEDQLDNTASSMDCKGTKSRGNSLFSGVREHRLIRLDYVSRNPTFGEIEYQIPFASGNNPLMRGRADMVNMLSGEMFEIKPNNPAGLFNGLAEVATYISKANQYCSSSLPFGASWHVTSNYLPVFMPTAQPNVYLKSEIIGSGVIGYSYVNSSTPPVPAPIIVPASVARKFKDLVDKLRGNLANADRIIAEYMAMYPQLKTYIKAAAIGAGVAIIVATLIDDLSIVGIADDIAGFTAAYRIIRFAILIP
jgi:hypothetical protein